MKPGQVVWVLRGGVNDCHYHSVGLIKTRIALLSIPSQYVCRLFFCSSKAAQGCLEEVSLNLCPSDLIASFHTASQIGWCLLGGFVCSGEVSHTDCTEGEQGDKSAWMWCSSGYIFSPPLQQKILKQEQDSATRIFLRKSAWSFFHDSPWERFTNPAPILAQFLIIWACKLDVVYGLRYCGFIYSAGPSLIPKKAVL